MILENVRNLEHRKARPLEYKEKASPSYTQFAAPAPRQVIVGTAKKPLVPIFTLFLTLKNS